MVRRKKMKTVLLLVVATLALSCVTNREALRVSGMNAVNITGVHLGQTAAEVKRVMRHEPESREVKTLPDGTSEERWNYLTDYNNDTNTTLVFRGGVLVEVGHEKWLGNGNFSTVGWTAPV
jgi:hypothetical protein